MADRRLVITIQGRPPTPNVRPGNRFARDRIVGEWREKAHVAANAAMGPGGTMSEDWPMELIRPYVPVGVRGRKHEQPALWKCTAPILYVVEYLMVFVVPDLRERDWDNAVASSKPVTDGLVAAGVLAGDSTRYIDPDGRRVTFRHEAGNSRLEITVVEGPPPGSFGFAAGGLIGPLPAGIIVGESGPEEVRHRM